MILIESLHSILISVSVRLSYSFSSLPYTPDFPPVYSFGKQSQASFAALFFHIYFRIIVLSTFPVRLDSNEIKFIF